MPRAHKQPAARAPQVIATLVTYVDQQGDTLLVAAVLPRKPPRFFPAALEGVVRRRATERAQRDAEARAEAWAVELGASTIERSARINVPVPDCSDLAAVVAMVGHHLAACFNAT